MAETLIDLGELGEEPPPSERRPPWRSLWRSRRERWRRPSRTQVRVGLVVFAVVFTVLTLGPSTVPLAPRFDGPIRIPGFGADEFFLTDDLVVVHTVNDRALRAYGLDGSLRWATGVPSQVAGPGGAVGGVVLVNSAAWPGQLGALDVVTGKVRWTLDGDLSAVVDGVVVVGSGQAEPGGDVRARDLTGIDPATGKQLWHEVIPPLTAGDRLLDVYGGTNNRVIARARVRDDGTGEVLDFRTGKWTTISGVPPAPPGPGSPVMPGTAAGYQIGIQASGVTMVFAVGAEPAEGASNISEPGLLVAYGPDAAGPRWTRTTGTWAPALPCGPWVCLADGAFTQVLDPGTGTELRRVRWPHVVSGNPRRFLGYDSTGTDLTTRVAVFDAATGRLVSEHLGWDIVSQRYADWTPIVHRDRDRGLRWQLATLSLETGTAYPLGSFDAAGERSCQSTSTHVACSVRSGEIMVWNHVPSR